MLNEETKTTEDEHGPCYWLLRHSRERGGAFLARHRRICLAAGGAAVLLLFLFRALLQPLVIGLRVRAFPLLLIAVFLTVLGGQLTKGSGKRRFLAGALGAAVILFGATWGREAYNFLALYFRHYTLEVRGLDQLPFSDYERVQPRNAIYSLAHEVMTENEAPTYPDLVRVGSEYRWTLAVEPAYFINRFWGGIKELMSVAAADPSPNFSRTSQIPVDFQTGENMFLSHNSKLSTIRAFDPWRYLNYEPNDVVFFTDDSGEWVEVVSLVRWSGFFFPRPEFGGVQIIRQHQGGLLNTVKRILVGSGQWISPAEIGNYAFLKGQNILATDVSRYMAESFRFQEGFLAPFPGYHQGDVRIPDSADGTLEQPFTGYFVLPGQTAGTLYHYFALEPRSRDKQGLNTSILIPADGAAGVYVYQHYQRGGSLTGVSAVSAKVMESRKIYDWTHNRPAEHRPFIKLINGESRFFWLTTVVTDKDDAADKRFIAGTTPDVVLTDARLNRSVWVNALAPQTWLESVAAGINGASELQQAAGKN